MNGVIVRDLNAGGKMPATFDGYQKVYAGNLLQCLFDIDVTPRCVGLIKDNGLTSPAYSQFELHGNAYGPYYDYLLRYMDDNKTLLHLSKNLRSSLTESEFGLIPTVLPPLAEQTRISNYLDAKCTEIDELVKLEERMITELQKYKQSVITETVTRGLNKTAKLKDSGVEWIGMIPEEWGVGKIKTILEWKSIKGHGDAEVLSLYRDWGVLPKNSRDDNYNVTSLNTDDYKFVQKGDFVINKMKAWQGSMALSNYEGIVSPAYYVCGFTFKNIHKQYFHYLMRNAIYFSEYRRLSTGMRIGQWDLSWDDFKQIPVLLPPLAEQTRISSYLDKKTEEIDGLIKLKESKIQGLKDYKKSLIYEYVTGKKKV